MAANRRPPQVTLVLLTVCIFCLSLQHCYWADICTLVIIRVTFVLLSSHLLGQGFPAFFYRGERPKILFHSPEGPPPLQKITGQKDFMVEAQFSFCYIIVTKIFLSAALQEGYVKCSLLLPHCLFIYLFICVSIYSTTFCGNTNDVWGNCGWETLFYVSLHFLNQCFSTFVRPRPCK